MFCRMLNSRNKNNIKNPTLNRHPLANSNYIGLNLLSLIKLPLRSFSTTSIRKADPLSTVVAAFNTPYVSSFLANPLGGAFILLMGMASTLFFVTMSLPEFFAQDISYAMILQRLEAIFLLYERFILYEQSGIDMLLANINNFSPEILGNFYLSLQELVTVRESLFSILSDFVNSPEMELMEGPTVDRANQILEDLRLGGNNLMDLIRNLEDRLNIGENERIPSFWFEG